MLYGRLKFATNGNPKTSREFTSFSSVFGTSRTCSDLFGRVRTRSDRFGSVRTKKNRSKIFDFFSTLKTKTYDKGLCTTRDYVRQGTTEDKGLRKTRGYVRQLRLKKKHARILWKTWAMEDKGLCTTRDYVRQGATYDKGLRTTRVYVRQAFCKVVRQGSTYLRTYVRC